MRNLTADRRPSSAEFHAQQLWLLLGGWIKQSEALAIVNCSDQHSAVTRLDAALELFSDETNLAQHQAARAYLATLASGTAPAARGSSRQDAIVVLSDNHEQGIALQYDWLEWQFGERDVDWKLLSRGHETPNEIVFDWFRVETIDGEKHYVEFDITSFYGCW